MNIKCSQNIFSSANGTSHITYYILYPADAKPRGIVQLVHGMCEYFGRYTVFAKYLCSLGFIVCGNDHIGHGASVTRGAELGFFAAQNGWRCLVDDTKQLTDIMQKRYPDLPYFMLGHSMGSLVERIYLTEYGQKLKGAIICGTVGPNPMVNVGMQLADSIARSKGMTYRSGLLSHITFFQYNKKYPQPCSPFAWLCRDSKIVELYESDEKCNFVFTAVGYRDLFTLMQKANASHCFRATPHALPLLLIAGDKDPVGNYGEGVRQVSKLYRAAGQKDVDVIFYKEGRHEILNELNRLDVFGDISRWLEQKLSDTEQKSTDHS